MRDRLTHHFYGLRFRRLRMTLIGRKRTLAVHEHELGLG